MIRNADCPLAKDNTYCATCNSETVPDIHKSNGRNRVYKKTNYNWRYSLCNYHCTETFGEMIWSSHISGNKILWIQHKSQI